MEIHVHKFKTPADRYTTSDSDSMESFLSDVCGGDVQRADHWLEAMMQGEMVIVGQDGPIDKMLVLTMPAERVRRLNILQAELRQSQRRHPSQLRRVLHSMERGNPARLRVIE